MSAERFKLLQVDKGSNRRNLKAFMMENETGVVVGMTFSTNHGIIVNQSSE